MLVETNKPSVAALELITPEQAAVWLAVGGNNRPLVPAVVKQYAAAMREGRWRPNGETIKFARGTGHLMDGQHRCAACIDAKVAFYTYVLRNVDPDTFDTIDVGRKRTPGDILGIDGYRNAIVLASAVRWLRAIRSDVLTTGLKMTADEIRLAVTMEPALSESASLCLSAKHIIGVGLIAALHFLFTEKDAAEADRFVRDLVQGKDLDSNDPVYVLREELIKRRLRRTKTKDSDRCALCIRAWQHRRTGRKTHFLKPSIITKGGTNRLYPPII